jgi:AAA+ superfamily predicted ATPase
MPTVLSEFAALRAANPYALPEWLQAMIDLFNSGAAHQFLLYGNLIDSYRLGNDYVPMDELLARILGRREVVVFYNTSIGGRFPRAGMRERFWKWVDPRRASSQRVIPPDPEVGLLYLEKLLHRGEEGERRAAVVIEYLETIAPQSPAGVERMAKNVVTLQRWANNTEIMRKGNLVVLLAANQASISRSLLMGSYRLPQIEVPKPGFAERRDFIAYLGGRFPDLRVQGTLDELAGLCGGLANEEIKDVFLRAHHAGEVVTPDLLTERKVQIINERYSDVVEVVRPAHGLEAVGGSGYVKEYLLQVARQMRAGNRRHVPMGIIIMGPPGTGKTFLVECFAKECGLLVVKARTIRSKYVGESERNQERFFSILRALAPVIVIIDESEQQEGARREGGAGSEVDNRMRAKNFQFWGDTSHRGRIVRIDITNWPHLIDPAMKRSGRTDAKIPLVLPDARDREAILRVILRKHGIRTRGVDLGAIARATEGYTPANLEQIVLIADQRALDRGREFITAGDLEFALDDFILPHRDQTTLDEMTLMALEEASRKSLRPPDADEIIARIRARLGRPPAIAPAGRGESFARRAGDRSPP